jgi:hypothetical protein
VASRLSHRKLFSQIARYPARKGKKASETVRRSNAVRIVRDDFDEDFKKFPAQLRNAPAYAGVHADYRRDDYVFPRTQSLGMRELKWDERMQPLKHWGSNLIANLAWEIFA